MREQYVDISLTVIRRLAAAAVGRFPAIDNETTGLDDVEDAIEGLKYNGQILKEGACMRKNRV